MASEYDMPELLYCNPAGSIDISTNSWISGYLEGPHGRIPILKTALDSKDRLGAIKVRMGIGRDNYKVPPGLYAVGSPTKNSPVLITANYKLTVDMLRICLKHTDAWIIVVDTKGVNVWCAAGKGTFGTYEVIKKIRELKLIDLVNHRNVILPQLCAPGVAAYQIIKHTGFRAVFGPIKADNVEEFLSNEMTEEMRTISFNAKSRLVLTPIEIVHNIKLLLIMLVSVMLYNLMTMSFLDIGSIVYHTMIGFVPLAAAVLTGCVTVPLLLPYIPFRAFAAKGLSAGLALDILLILFKNHIYMLSNNWLLITGYCLIIPAITALLSLKFTGSSTYTSFSGAKKETKLALPFIKIGIVAGIALTILSILQILY